MKIWSTQNLSIPKVWKFDPPKIYPALRYENLIHPKFIQPLSMKILSTQKYLARVNENLIHPKFIQPKFMKIWSDPKIYPTQANENLIQPQNWSGLSFLKIWSHQNFIDPKTTHLFPSCNLVQLNLCGW